MNRNLALYLLLFCSLVVLKKASAQFLTIPAEGVTKKATVGERIALTDVTIHYDRPDLQGREGKIWGQLVYYGFQDQGFGTSKQAPWRAGANENTTITFGTDVQVEGRPLSAGKYALFMAVYADSVSVIFSNNTSSWGSYFYDPAEDALRVTVRPVKNQPLTERLTYEFLDQTDRAATVALRWENWKIPFRVEVDLEKTVLASFRNELRGERGFEWQAWNRAAAYALRNKFNLTEALDWAEKSISLPYVGEANFTTLSTKAELLERLDRGTEAAVIRRQAVELGSMQELHVYARQLLNQKKAPEALEIFKLNAQRHPNQFTTNVGLARGYSSTGDYKNALKFAKLALPQAPDSANRTALEAMIEQLGKGQPLSE
jgi:tetratricopeptide (TPR) repeat protein